MHFVNVLLAGFAEFVAASLKSAERCATAAVESPKEDFCSAAGISKTAKVNIWTSKSRSKVSN